MHGESAFAGGAAVAAATPSVITTTTSAANGAQLNLTAAPSPNTVLNSAASVLNVNVKDSRWLQLEVCREFQRGQCSRSDLECKFAHPPPHVEIQNGRVTACYDSIKGRCTRENPKCKYLHPPQHLKDQLLINGRNNLVLKNLMANQMTAAQIATPLSISSLATMPGTSALIPNIAATYNPYAAYTLNAATLYPGLISASAADPYGMLNGLVPAANHAATIAAMQKMMSSNAAAVNRADRVEAFNTIAVANAAALAAAAAQSQSAAAYFMTPTQSAVSAASLQPLLAMVQQQQPQVLGSSRKRHLDSADVAGASTASQQQESWQLLAAAAALNSPMNKRAAVEKGGVPVMQPIYQTFPAIGAAMPYQTFTVPGLTASYMIPATSISGSPATLARF